MAQFSTRVVSIEELEESLHWGQPNIVWRVPRLIDTPTSTTIHKSAGRPNEQSKSIWCNRLLRIFSMPKKRFSTQFSKPQTTVHPSLGSSSSSANKNDAPPTVNDLISSSRKSNAVPGTQVTASSQTPSLPPQIRHLLSQPERPIPRLRYRRRVDENGRPLPAGPPPPQSWVERSRSAQASMTARGDERVYPSDLRHLPGMKEATGGKRLRDTCMRAMAKHWESLRIVEQHHLAESPTSVRMELLSFVAVGGPDDGVGFEALKHILLTPKQWTQISGGNDKLPVMDDLSISPTHSKIVEKQPVAPESPPEDWDTSLSTSISNMRSHNEDFFRLDLSGAMGNSISFKQLSSLLESPSSSLSALLPRVTHLSLSNPSQSVSWRSLLALSKHIPTLTHLCLAYWPAPTLTPNARTAVMSSRFGKDVQYGGTNLYSHTVDNDFLEAADVLRRLASNLYGLEYLDLSGCSDWFRAMRWTGLENEAEPIIQGIDWSTQFLKLKTLRLFAPRGLTPSSSLQDVTIFVRSVKEARKTQNVLNGWMVKGKRLGNGQWIDVEYDDWGVYRDLWRDEKATEERSKRHVLLALLGKRDGVNSEDEDEFITRFSLG